MPRCSSIRSRGFSLDCGRQRVAYVNGSSEPRIEASEFEASEVVSAWADISHALRGFYELASILVVLDEVVCLEISILARQLKINSEITDDHPVIGQLTASL